MQELTGQAALDWFIRNGATEDELAFLRGEVARGAGLSIQFFEGPLPHLSNCPLAAEVLGDIKPEAGS